MNKFKDYFSRVDRLTSIYLPTGELPVVALAGPYNTGKSTMVNNLLEQQVSPVDVLPTTSIPVIFSRGKLFSITARLVDGRIKALSSAELKSLPKGKKSFARQVLEVEVCLNHELLRRMRLVDTPGFDAANGTDVLPDLLAKADYIIYMLHQRGPGEADRKFIGQLLESAGAEKLSFWINRNLGNYDGTSLTESRRVLREICAREIQVHVTDTMNQEAVRRFRLFIQDRAATVVLNSVACRLKELDSQIPGLTSHSLQEKSDQSFLIHFWDARQTAKKVIQGHDMIKTLPLVSKQISASVDELIKPEKELPDVSAVSVTREAAPDPVLVRGRIKSLLTRATDDPLLQSEHETITLLQALAGELEQEHYLVTAAGGFSTGKTTFFNALLGEILLPAENRPTTFTVTRLIYGDRKKAVIKFADQVTIPTHYVEKKHAIICRHELEVLERWLTDSKLRSGISALEKVKKGRSSSISPDELQLEIEKLKETFARVKHRSKKGRRTWKSLFKRIPLASFNGSKRADNYVVHFPRRESIKLDLTNETDLKVLEQTAGSHQALRVKEIEIRHPAEILHTADFLDTPGLDSVYHRHREITTRYLPDSDCFLFFLNGKHILTKPDLGTYNIISGALNRTGSNNGKLFIIVNFADALNEREKERVRNYLHANLMRPSRGAPNPVGIYLVSALDAVTGRDGRALSSL
ncbi:MAG: dynamin family protein, partial [Desulfotomaculaceae bacterium]